MNYKETCEYIENLNQYGSVLGLENMIELCNRLDNPQDKLQFIHIAGTNGKGSTLSFVTTILIEAKIKTGCYVSPTLIDYRERFVINNKMISKVELSSYMTRVKTACDDMVSDGYVHPTPFEVETALAFLYFYEKKCEIVVLETGLGGRLDATNIIKNTLVCVLASISKDHMAFLGATYEKIAAEKCGIIKKDCKVISTWQKEEVKAVIETHAKEKDIEPVFVMEENIQVLNKSLKSQSFHYKASNGKDYKKLQVKLLGENQIQNATLALEVIHCLNEINGDATLKYKSISEDQIRQGLLKTQWLGRFSILSTKPYFIVDGAHNEDGAKKLASTTRFYFTNKKIIYIMGVLKDKEVDKIIESTIGFATSVITVQTPNNERAMPAYELARLVSNYHSNVTNADSIEEAIEMSYLMADQDSVIIAFGSLSYLGKVISIMEPKSK